VSISGVGASGFRGVAFSPFKDSPSNF